MAEAVDSGGGSVGGVAGGGICVPTPSELEGSVYNLLDRIRALEDKVNMMLGANVTADQLSDIAQQVGWVGGIVLNGVGGFTRTEGGTLIPPPGVSLSSLGWTMSDGNVYPIVLMNPDGSLAYGFGTTPGGDAVVGGNLAAGQAFAAYFSDGNIHAQDAATYSGEANWLASGNYDPNGMFSHPNPPYLRVVQSGWYLITLGVSIGGVYSAGDNAELIISVDNSPNTAPFDDTNFPVASGVNVYFQPKMTFGQMLTSARLCYIDKNALTFMHYVKSGTSSLFIGKAMVTFQLVKAG